MEQASAASAPKKPEDRSSRRAKERKSSHSKGEKHHHGREPPGPDASASEKAKYELERKRVAKYKEDKLRARRDHTRMILESHAQNKRRALLGSKSEFLATLEFRNDLPDVPFDPKFVQYPHEPNRLVKYKPNTLEKDYTFQVHEEPDLGLQIDLIDPAKYEAPEAPPKLEIGDEQVLHLKENGSKASAKNKVRPSVSWLRRTEYMGNDLYDSVHKFKSEVEIQSALREGTETALADEVSVSLEDRAEASFEDVKKTETLTHPFKRSMKATKVWDVFPDQVLGANHYSILSYDLLPSNDVKSKSMKDKERRALLCDVSAMSQSNSAYYGSLLLPGASSNDEERKEESEPTQEKFSYYREYHVSINSLQNKEDSQHCIFVLDPNSDQFTYSDIYNRVQLKKTKGSGDEKRRHGALVHRREYSEAELQSRNGVLLNYGGIYDPSLDEEEPDRKRRRVETSGEEDASAEEETKESSGLKEGEEESKEDKGGSPMVSDESGSESDE